VSVAVYSLDMLLSLRAIFFLLSLSPLYLLLFSFFFIYCAGVEPSPLLLWPFIGLLYQPWMIDGDDCVAVSGMNEEQGKPECSEKTCPSAAFSATNPT
jgi:hypothetical protein